MSNVLRLDATFNDGIVGRDLVTPISEVWMTVDVAFDSTYLTNLLAQPYGASVMQGQASTFSDEQTIGIWHVSTTPKWIWDFGTPSTYTPASPITALQFYTVEMHLTAGSPMATEFWISGTSVGPITIAAALPDIQYLALRGQGGFAGYVYYDNFRAGTTRGGSDIYADDFEGDLSGWTDAVISAAIVTDPGIAPSTGGPPAPPPPAVGRVWIAFDDGPLVASPTWTPIDSGDAPFPQNFVSGYDVRVGRQTLLSQTDTGDATVYINDRDGLFDPRNVSSPYFGKLAGRQILLQLYDPVAATWEDQFRGHIDDITWDIDGSAVNAAGEPINASIQLECVDIFDFLGGFGLTPGLAGVDPAANGDPPPAGAEDSVYYATTAGTVDDRILAILNDVRLDPTRSLVASGNVHVLATKYDPDESALQALRDAADAELPFIANIYCDRHGVFVFRGRYSRFYPDDTAAEPGSAWDFTRWAAGDGTAIVADSDRAQLRTFAFGRNRSDIINVAICYPQDLLPADMPSQVFADTTSITAYGKHSAPPMSDLLLDKDATQPATGLTGKAECFRYAKLHVKNQKDPRETLTTLGFKSIRPDGSTRAQKTWALITKADISHIVNVAVGYPGGTGFAGDSPDDDYYIEGRRLRVRPLNPSHDYVELDLDVSPAVWSMDTHGVFPNPFA